jgi:hypothetical protein
MPRSNPAERKLAKLIRDTKLKVYLTTDGSTCNDTLSRIIYVLTVGTDIAIMQRLKGTDVLEMHRALIDVGAMCRNAHKWDASKVQRTLAGLDTALNLVEQNSGKSLEDSFRYAGYLSTKAANGTLEVKDIIGLDVHNT